MKKAGILILCVLLIVFAVCSCDQEKKSFWEQGDYYEVSNTGSAEKKAFHYQIFDAQHNMIDSADTDDTEPFFYAEGDYLRLSLNYGSGAAEYKYYDVSKGRVSELYTTVLSDRFTEDGVLVACLTHKNDDVAVTVQDPFDKEAFYRTFKGEFPIKFSPSTQAEFISDNQLKITYLTGEDNKEITELFNFVLSTQFTPHKFCPDDAIINGVRIGSTPEEVKAVLGQPKEEFTNDHQWYSQRIGMMYDGFDLEFYDIHSGNNITLGALCCMTPELHFVNGLHVGSTKDEVLETFTYEENPAPLYIASLSGQQGSYIYGDTNSSWFYETKPTGFIQSAYIEPRDECFGNSYTMSYDYCEPLIWKEDMSDYSEPLYRLVFELDGETDTVTQISMCYIMICETMC